MVHSLAINSELSYLIFNWKCYRIVNKHIFLLSTNTFFSMFSEHISKEKSPANHLPDSDHAGHTRKARTER